MSRKRTRSSKTTPENLILIDEEVKERFDSIFKHQPMMPKKGINLKSNDLKVIPMPIRKKINALKWELFCDARLLPDDELVREFYARLTTQDATEVIVQRKKGALQIMILKVIDTEEEESDKESNSPKPAEGYANPKPRVDPEEETVKLSVEYEFSTPILISTSTSKKLELSIMMDMCKFMHKQQQTYWKYAKVRDDSIQNTFKNIYNTFVPEFPDAIFETWTEDTDYTSRDGDKEDKGNESNK
ncbi:hypothetical protein J1N35_011766 [Gossypium stocksii]|uniref:Uncharacterized protein n=1 Tax=Gossypium stocksii TaxID=47602 RepID=A0A9D4ADP2_9ROSI|nr:hypothetical protein J1N35_011766 [Gossypium stocksii]